MTFERTLDVSHLPDAAIDSRGVLWWGQIGMMLIETVVFALIVAAYFYIRIGFSVWPPPDIAPPNLFWPTVNLILVLASCIPMYLSSRAMERRRFVAAAVWMALNVLMALVFLWIRRTEFLLFNFKWVSDVYGSLVWTLLGLHTMHTIGDTLESIVFVAITASGRVGAKQQLGAKMDAIYWYWITATYALLYLLIYIYPAALRGTL